jgi:hypothetical protein
MERKKGRKTAAKTRRGNDNIREIEKDRIKK